MGWSGGPAWLGLNEAQPVRIRGTKSSRRIANQCSFLLRFSLLQKQRRLTKAGRFANRPYGFNSKVNVKWVAWEDGGQGASEDCGLTFAGRGETGAGGFAASEKSYAQLILRDVYAFHVRDG